MSRSRIDQLWIILAIVLAASALLSIGPQNAQAQTQETTITVNDFWVFNGHEVQAGARDKLKVVLDLAQKCPSTISVAAYIPHGSYAAETAHSRGRKSTLQGLFRELARIDDVKVTNIQTATIFPRGHNLFGDADHLDIDVSWTLKPEQEKPILDVVWTPSKGTKVKPGDKITAKLTARDDATTSQTGIARLRVDVGVGGGLVAAPAQYPSPVPLQECGRENPVRTYEATYTVPSNPPPVVQLRAYARDFAGNEIWVDAEFPTKGDWYGRIDWWIPFPAGRLWGRLDLTFDDDGKGNLTGRMAGDSHTEAQSGPSCRMITQTPAKLSANLVGQYTPGRNAMSLAVADRQIEQGQFSLVGCGAASGGPFEGSGPLGQPALAQLLNSLTVRADGSVIASGVGLVIPAAVPQTTLHLTLTLRRTQN